MFVELHVLSAFSFGALYRLFCSPAGWFVEGSYD
jgi:hypothetical protein